MHRNVGAPVSIDSLQQRSQASSLTPTLVAFDRQPATVENSFE
jgi:hypothetical protein